MCCCSVLFDAVCCSVERLRRKAKESWSTRLVAVCVQRVAVCCRVLQSVALGSRCAEGKGVKV